VNGPKTETIKYCYDGEVPALPAAPTTENEIYAAVLEDFMYRCAYENMDSGEKNQCRAQRLDLDGDGQLELILRATNIVKSYSSGFIYEVWTIKDGSPVCALDNPQYVGFESDISLVEYQGKRYIGVHSFIGASSALNDYYKYYDVSALPYQESISTALFEMYDGPESEYCINGEKVTKSAYNQFHSEIEVLYSIFYEWVGEFDGLWFYDMLNLLKN
jgi:hypothetical protein